jgi:hypothetical protein
MRAEFEVFMRTATELEPSLRALAAMATGADTFIETPLSPPPDCIVRTEVLTALRAKLRTGRIIFAQASTGMGNTTLAKMLAAANRACGNGSRWLGCAAKLSCKGSVRCPHGSDARQARLTSFSTMWTFPPEAMRSSPTPWQCSS